MKLDSVSSRMLMFLKKIPQLQIIPQSSFSQSRTRREVATGKRFRFENSWLREGNCKSIVEKCSKQTGSRDIFARLKATAAIFRHGVEKEIRIQG